MEASFYSPAFIIKKIGSASAGRMPANKAWFLKRAPAQVKCLHALITQGKLRRRPVTTEILIIMAGRRKFRHRSRPLANFSRLKCWLQKTSIRNEPERSNM